MWSALGLGGRRRGRGGDQRAPDDQPAASSGRAARGEQASGGGSGPVRRIARERRRGARGQHEGRALARGDETLRGRNDGGDVRILQELLDRGSLFQLLALGILEP